MIDCRKGELTAEMWNRQGEGKLYRMKEKVKVLREKHYEVQNVRER